MSVQAIATEEKDTRLSKRRSCPAKEDSSRKESWSLHESQTEPVEVQRAVARRERERCGALYHVGVTKWGEGGCGMCKADCMKYECKRGGDERGEI